MIKAKGRWLKDEHGRTVLLRGVNLGGSSKVPRTPDGATHIRQGFFDHRDVSFVGRPFPLEEADEHLKRIQHLFPKPRGVARVDDRRVLSGIIHVIRNGLRWRDAPSDYVPHKTLYNRWARWSQLGVFIRIVTELAAQGDATKT